MSLQDRKLKKVKNIYFAETKEEREIVGGRYTTGLVIELEDGRFFRHLSTDVIIGFEEFSLRATGLDKPK